MREVVELTKDLIRFQSMHARPDEIRRCGEFIEDYLKTNGIGYSRFDWEGYPSILVMPSEGAAPVLLMSHIDVVDAPEAMFDPVERDGRLYGRGSIDDKYAAALSLVLLKNQMEELRKAGKGQESLPVGILITGDEEVGGHNGAAKALRMAKTDFCIALDGGTVDKIVTKEKGLLWLKLISRGKAAHGSRPWLGENAIEKLMEDFVRLKAFFEKTTADHWHRTVNLSILRAGISTNQVPESAEATLDIRYTENDDPDSLVAAIREKIRSELIVERKEPMFLGGDSPYLQMLLSIARGTATGMEHGASDARFLVDFGIDGIVWGADGDMSAHSADEHVNVESLFRLYRYLEAFLRKIGSERPARA